MFDLAEKFLFKVCGRLIVVCTQELKEILEHTAGCTRSRHELGHDVSAFILICFPSFDISVPLRVRGRHNAVSMEAAASNFKNGKPFSKQAN